MKFDHCLAVVTPPYSTIVSCGCGIFPARNFGKYRKMQRKKESFVGFLFVVVKITGTLAHFEKFYGRSMSLANVYMQKLRAKDIKKWYVDIRRRKKDTKVALRGN